MNQYTVRCTIARSLPSWTTKIVTYNLWYFKVVLEGCWRYLFGVKVKTVKLIGGRRGCYICMPKSYRWWHSLGSWLSGLELLSTACCDSVATIANFATVDTLFHPVDRIPKEKRLKLSKKPSRLRLTTNQNIAFFQLQSVTFQCQFALTPLKITCLECHES